MKRESIKNLADAIAGLCEANYLTGYWDNKRNELRKKYDESKHRRNAVTVEQMIETERMSRSNCEKRAKHRLAINKAFGELING